MWSARRKPGWEPVMESATKPREKKAMIKTKQTIKKGKILKDSGRLTIEPMGCMVLLFFYFYFS
jgi:hypothetical protein